jgi:hypothetical protein
MVSVISGFRRVSGSWRAESTRRASATTVAFLFSALTLSAHAAISPKPFSGAMPASKVNAAPLAPIDSAANDFQSDTQIRVRLDTLKVPFSLSGQGLRFSGEPSRNANAYQAVRVSWRSVWSKDPNSSTKHLEWTVEDRDSGAVLTRFTGPHFEAIGTNLRVNLKPIPNRVTLTPQTPSASFTGRDAQRLAARSAESTSDRGAHLRAL